MSQENVELVRRCYGLWTSREFSAIPEVMDPELQGAGADDHLHR